MAPCPTAGTICLKSRNRNSTPDHDANPSRLRPAAASTLASAAPQAIFLRRVSTLPRISVNAAPGYIRAICSRRRGLPVAMVSGVRTPARNTSTSRGSSRGR